MPVQAVLCLCSRSVKRSLCLSWGVQVEHSLVFGERCLTSVLFDSESDFFFWCGRILQLFNHGGFVFFSKTTVF